MPNSIAASLSERGKPLWTSVPLSPQFPEIRATRDYNAADNDSETSAHIVGVASRRYGTNDRESEWDKTMKSKRLLTTGDVARLCGFSASAVLQWVRSGKLDSYSSPGGQHRIEPEGLLTFLRAHNMRIPPELEPGNREHRILIVDSDEGIRNVLESTLLQSAPPCLVESAANGVTGCMKLPTFKPDLVVIDMLTPGLDVVEVCRSVKTDDELSGTKILLITARPDDDRLELARRAGADDWTAKPVSVDEFLRKVRALLGIAADAKPSDGNFLSWNEEPRR